MTIPISTIPVADLGDLPGRSPISQTSAWIHDGRGMIAWGEYASVRLRGLDALRDGEDWFAGQIAECEVTDAVRRPGTGPIAFVSGSFDPEQADTVFVIPEFILGRDEFGCWLTHIGGIASTSDVPGQYECASPGIVTYSDGSLEPAQWERIVAEAINRIRAGRLDKVVLARDILAQTTDPIDPRLLIGRLATEYNSCWTYCVDGLVGATPELLVRLIDGHVYSRVLAGTEWGEGAYERVRRPKNFIEHEYAAQSAIDSLAKVCIRLDAPAEPKVLTLPNVVHLATEIRGDVADNIGPSQVAAAMHPTAAVGGTPRDIALATITELEQLNRGRYAGPVGWIDAHHNGEFGIALRGGQILDPHTIQLFAGCGIVADSDPESELAETISKFVVMRDALETRSAELAR